MKAVPEVILNSKPIDLGGFLVQRVLPMAVQRMVGPFIFLDHMGPHEFPVGKSMVVRAHPHIGLSTLTYLFAGRIHHRDSLGYSQVIEVGDVNWMIAGKGIAHSERGVEGDDSKVRTLHGLQFWVALPDSDEDQDPSFVHYGKSQLPKISNVLLDADVIVGEWQGQRSPVKCTSPTIFINIKGRSSGKFSFKTESNQLAIYVLAGTVTVAGSKYQPMQLLVFSPQSEIEVEIDINSHFVMFGGLPFVKPKQIWWNFVSSSKEKMEIAKTNWNNGDFPMVPSEVDRIMAPQF